MLEFEEKFIRCAKCGRKIKVVIRKNYDTSGLMCQRCGQDVERIDDGEY